MAKKKQIVRFMVTGFPENTKNIFICGDHEGLGNWDASKAVQMQYYQKEEGKECFFVDLKVSVGSSVRYKYLSDTNWKNVECGVVAQEIEDRIITIKEGYSRLVEDTIKNFRG